MLPLQPVESGEHQSGAVDSTHDRPVANGRVEQFGAPVLEIGRLEDRRHHHGSGHDSGHDDGHYCRGLVVVVKELSSDG